MRVAETLDASLLTKGKFLGIQRVNKFSSFVFHREFQSVKGFNCSTVPGEFLTAALIDRKLHVYDYISTDKLFDLNISSAGGFKLQSGSTQRLSQQQVFFLDSD